MTQFTANEVRELAKHMESVGWQPDSKGDPECYDEGAARSAEILFAFADMLEAREKAEPMAWWNKRTGQILRPHELDAIPDAPHPHSYFKNGFVPLTAHSAQAQPPAASVPTMRFFIGGPKACAYVDKFEHVEAVITALCKCTGDARDDYTSTDLLASERVR